MSRRCVARRFRAEGATEKNCREVEGWPGRRGVTGTIVVQVPAAASCSSARAISEGEEQVP